jgi:hypothetical protein
VYVKEKQFLGKSLRMNSVKDVIYVTHSSLEMVGTVVPVVV